MIDQGHFFVPGPTEVRPEVLAVMSRPLVFHRSPPMEELMQRVTPGLSAVFGTQRPVHVITGSGTAAMDMAIRSGTILSVLSIVHGDFGERFARMAEACGRRVTRLKAEAGDVVPLEQIREALAAGHYDAVTVTHSETATGVRADVAGIAELVKEDSTAMLLVDAVSSAAAMPILMDEWGADAVVSASQKAFALPPGLAFAAVSEPFLARARKAMDRGTYMDVLRYEEFTAKYQSPTTPAVSLLYALDRQMADIQREGLDARFRRHSAMAEACASWVERARKAGLDVTMVAREGHRSTSVSCIATKAPDAVRARMREKGYELGGGQAELSKTTFRVGHMGDHTVAGLETMLGELERVLRTPP